MKRGWRPWILLVLRLTVGGIFVYSGALKIWSPQAFADGIFTFQILPGSFIAPLALALPSLEVIIGALLITGWQLRASSFSVIILCLVFLFAILQALVRGLEVNCGCFGSGTPSHFKTWIALGRDILLFGCAWCLFVTAPLPAQARDAIIS